MNPMTPRIITVLVADDHPVTRGGLSLILNSEPGVLVVAEASNGEQAVDLYQKHLPSVAILDLQMPKLNGLGATKQILTEFPDAKVLLLTTYDGDEDIYRAIQAGARGYVLKDAPEDELLHAVRIIDAGSRYLSPPVGAKLADFRSSPAMTEREQQVLRLLAKGYANKEIGTQLEISESTVKTHVAAVIAKLGVTSRTEAALVGEKRGYLRE